jgi:hypothetical protein
MGASGGGYRCHVPEIRAATPVDVDAVLARGDAPSRAAPGISKEKPEFERRGRWAPPGTQQL